MTLLEQVEAFYGKAHAGGGAVSDMADHLHNAAWNRWLTRNRAIAIDHYSRRRDRIRAHRQHDLRTAKAHDEAQK